MSQVNMGVGKLVLNITLTGLILVPQYGYSAELNSPANSKENPSTENTPPFLLNDEDDPPPFLLEDENDSPPFPPEDENDSPPFLLNDEDDSPPFLLEDENDSPPFPPEDENDSPPFLLNDEDDSPPFLLNDEDDSPPFLLEDENDSPPFLLNDLEVDSNEISTLNTLETENEDTDDEAEEERKPPFFSFLDRHQRVVSAQMQRFIQGVDNFLAKSDTIDGLTGSYIRLTLENYWAEGQGIKLRGAIRIKARLPKTEKKLKLVFESTPDERQTPLDLQTRETTTENSADSTNTYYAGLESDVGLFGIKIRPSVGLKLRFPLDFYVRLRGERTVLFDSWKLDLRETLFWFDSSGFGSDSLMRWDRPIDQSLLFRTNSFARYTDLNDYFELSQTVELIHKLSKRRVITYKAGIFGDNNGSLHATSYLTNLLYRHKLHSDYLFLDVQPQVIFKKENNFKPEKELLIRIQFYYRG